jgi:hypothetical protein
MNLFVFGKCPVRVWDGTEVFESLQANTGILPRLFHGRFLPNPFQFISNSTIQRYTLSATDSIVKQKTTNHRIVILVVMSLCSQRPEDGCSLFP